MRESNSFPDKLKTLYSVHFQIFLGKFLGKYFSFVNMITQKTGDANTPPVNIIVGITLLASALSKLPFPQNPCVNVPIYPSYLEEYPDKRISTVQCPALQTHVSP